MTLRIVREKKRKGLFTQRGGERLRIPRFTRHAIHIPVVDTVEKWYGQPPRRIFPFKSVIRPCGFSAMVNQIHT